MQVMSLLPAERLAGAPVPSGWSVNFPPPGEWQLAIARADFLLGGMAHINKQFDRCC